MCDSHKNGHSIVSVLFCVEVHSKFVLTTFNENFILLKYFSKYILAIRNPGRIQIMQIELKISLPYELIRLPPDSEHQIYLLSCSYTLYIHII